MPPREELGRRIKKTRERKHLTLKAVESASGISATHVSEIERGKTSPTVGVLVRIADALETDPAYFLEEEELGLVSLVTAEDRVRESLPDAAGSIERLTTSIPGGRLQACYLTLAPGAGHRREPHGHGGEEAALVTAGRVRFVVGGHSVELGAGDAIHLDASAPHAYENGSAAEEAALVWLCSDRNAT